jgi:hypothetical protein
VSWWVPILVLLALTLFLYYALRGRGIAWWLLVPIVVTSLLGALMLTFIAFQVVMALLTGSAEIMVGVPKPEGPDRLTGLTYTEAKEVARDLGMECEDHAADESPLLSSCRGALGDGEDLYLVNVLGRSREQVGMVEVFAGDCEGALDRTEAVGLLTAVAESPFEDEDRVESARLWVRQNAYADEGKTTIEGVELSLDSLCDAGPRGVRFSIRAVGYLPGL